MQNAATVTQKRSGNCVNFKSVHSDDRHFDDNSIGDDVCCTYSVPLLKNFVREDIFNSDADILVDCGADVNCADVNILYKYKLDDFGYKCMMTDRHSIQQTIKLCMCRK